MTATVAPSRDATVEAPVAAVPGARRVGWLVVAALVCAFAVRVAIGLTDDAPSTDETAYLRSGISLIEGDGFERDGHPELHFPPLVPVLLGLGSLVFDDPHTGTVVLTVLAGTAVVLPLSWLARRLAGPNAGVAAAWIAALAPATATSPTNRGAGSEATYVLLVVLALCFVVAAADERGRARLLRVAGAGASIGLAYLTRPEGLFVGIPLGLAVVALALRPTTRPAPDPAAARPGPDAAEASAADGTEVAAGRTAPGVVLGAGDGAGAEGPHAGAGTGEVDRTDVVVGGPRSGLRGVVDRFRRARWADWRGVGPVVAAYVAPILLCVAPYATYLHGHTGTWQLTAKTQDASIEAWQAVARADRQARDAVLYALDDSGYAFSTERTSLPSLALDDPGAYLEVLRTNVGELVQAVVHPVSGQLLSWLLLPLPVWGLVGLGLWRYRRSGAMQLLVAVSALPVATSLVFFVQPRYLMAAATLAVVPAAVAVAGFAGSARRVLAAGTVALLVLSSVQAFEGPGGWWHPADHTDQRLAGEWLAAHTEPGDRVMTRSMIVGYYAGRPSLAIPYADIDTIVDFGRHYGAQYLVVDWYTVRRLRPQLAELREFDEVPGLRLVHEVVSEGRYTRVFAFDPAPDPDVPMGPSLGFVGDG